MVSLNEKRNGTFITHLIDNLLWSIRCISGDDQCSHLLVRVRWQTQCARVLVLFSEGKGLANRKCLYTCPANQKVAFLNKRGTADFSMQNWVGLGNQASPVSIWAQFCSKTYWLVRNQWKLSVRESRPLYVVWHVRGVRIWSPFTSESYWSTQNQWKLTFQESGFSEVVLCGELESWVALCWNRIGWSRSNKIRVFHKEFRRS